MIWPFEKLKEDEDFQCVYDEVDQPIKDLLRQGRVDDAQMLIRDDWLNDKLDNVIDSLMGQSLGGEE